MPTTRSQSTSEDKTNIPVPPPLPPNTQSSPGGSQSGTVRQPIQVTDPDDFRSISNLVEINTLFKFIKPFDGDREKLVPFLNNCDSAFNLANEDQGTILLAYTKAQLTGKAEAACANHVFRTWDALKEYLKSMYSDKKHHGHLLMELLSCKQIANETVSQYMYRIETCLKRVLTSIQQGRHPQEELPGRIASMNDLALHTFILNAKPEISQMLRAREITKLNEAFNIAIEEEKVALLLNQQKPEKKFCNNCKRSGHTAQNCFRKSGSNATQNKNSSKLILNSTGVKTCKYCKAKGHNIFECEKRKRANQRNQTQRDHSENNKVNKEDNKQGNIRTLDVSAAVPRELSHFAALNLN